MNNDPMNTNTQNEQPRNIYCPRCGKPLPADSAFCGECGANLKAAPETASAPAPMTAAPADTAPLSTADYLILHLVNMIPLVGFILMLMWSFSDNVNLNRRNFCRAYLIVYAVSFILSIFLIALYAVILGTVFSNNVAITEDIFEAFGMIFR